VSNDFGQRLDLDGPTAPPRANGELVFEAPWQSRVFGLTMSLCDTGAITWSRFRDCLIESIGEWDHSHDESESGYDYWERWLAALTGLLEEGDLLEGAALTIREQQYAARPHGHDH
jgi:nitrile hydratase accessory protein